MSQPAFDVVIIGGGPAGLSAALLLGRCCRNVLVCDDGNYRNAYSQEMHGFLTRDGIDPAELRKIGREQLKRYENVQIWDIHVRDAKREGNGFLLALEDGRTITARKVLLATGIKDTWPKIKGAEALYGKSIFHCPYCDGWEMRNQRIALLARGDKGGDFALEMTLWSRNLILCSNGPSELSDSYLERLGHHHIPIYEEPIASLEGQNGTLKKIVFTSGNSVECRALFFNAKCTQRSDLAARLGCAFDENGSVICGKYETTTVPGLFVAGDASRDVFQAIVGAGEGAQAAFAINTSLLAEDLKTSSTSS